MPEELRYSNLLGTQKQDKLATYLLTSDAHEASQLWLPQIYGSTRQPVNWTMNYLVPRGCSVVSSGKFIGMKEISAKNKDLHIFKSKTKIQAPETGVLNPVIERETKGKILPDKIGFVIGDLPHVSMIFKEKGSQDIRQIGAGLFVSASKMQLFESREFYSHQILAIVDDIEKMLRTKHACNQEGAENQAMLKMIFVPNLFRTKSIKQSIDFADGIHIFDEEVLLPRNVIEKRHKIYKTLASSIAYDFFGAMVWEEAEEDSWLLTGLRERIGDRYKRKKTGQSMYRYQIMKTMRKFTEAVEQNSERFSLGSKYVPHFSELTYGEDLWFWKCQLIMHIVEQILGETHFFSVSRELLNKSTPTMSVMLFKKILKEFGIKFDDIKKNWIDSTSCPQIECSYSYNKKNNAVNINLEQRSLVKNFLLLKKHISQNRDKTYELFPKGNTLV